MFLIICIEPKSYTISLYLWQNLEGSILLCVFRNKLMSRRSNKITPIWIFVGKTIHILFLLVSAS